MCHGLLLTESAVGRTVPGSNRGQYIPSRPPLRLHLRHQDGQGGRHQGAKQLHPPLSSRPPLLFPTFEVNCIMVVAIIMEQNSYLLELAMRLQIMRLHADMRLCVSDIRMCAFIFQI